MIYMCCLDDWNKIKNFGCFQIFTKIRVDKVIISTHFQVCLIDCETAKVSQNDQIRLQT